MKLTAIVVAGALAAASTGAERAVRAVPQWGWGFTGPWDARSDTSVRAHSAQLEAVISGWIVLDSVTGRAGLTSPDTLPLLPATRRMAIVTTGHGGRFHPESIRRLGVDSMALAATAGDVGRLVAEHKYRGIVIDFEDHTAADLPVLLRAVGSIASAARRGGATTVAVAIPATDTAAYPTRAFIPAADFVVVMLYDEHWSTSGPGPIASPAWVRGALARRVGDVGADKIVAALPVYGYQWRTGSPTRDIGFADARRAAVEAGVTLVRDPVSQHLHAVQPGKWELWVSDSELLLALRREVQALGVQRTALWRLGLEDPAIWRGR